MEDVGLKPWPKVTSGKGYHVTAPLPERMTHDQAHQFAHEVARQIAGKKSIEIAPILGYSGRSAMVHRDDMVMSVAKNTRTGQKETADA